MAPLIVENVAKEFHQGDRTVNALSGVTLSVERGQFLAIMGASGSGKSTLLHPGLVFQSFNLIPTLTAEENDLLPLMLDGKSNGTGREKVTDLLTNLGLASRKHHRPDAMSGGEQQRVAIGRALATDPAVILADEPTGNLDSANSKSVCELLRDLSDKHGRTIVMVTHEPSVAAYAQEVAVLRDGRLID